MAKSAFYDIVDTPEEATNLTARSVLMIAIEQRIREKGWTQARAAQALRIRQPRVSDLMNGKIDKFSLDALVNMLPAVGLTFNVKTADDTGPGLSRVPTSAEVSRSSSRTHAPAAAATRGRPMKAAAAAGGKRAVAKAGRRSAAKATKK